MAVQPQTPYKEYTANGSTNSFALEFDCENQDHLIVLVDDAAPSVGTWSFSNGAVVFGTAPASGKKITIQRNTPFNRTAEYQSFNNSFRPQTVNIDFDRIWLKLQELGVADWLMKLYVDRLHQQQEQKINGLKVYVDDRDDELRAYLMEEIRKQGVALDQLDEYYNYLMQRLAQIAVDKGWEASFVVDASGKNQQEINNNTAYFYANVAAMISDTKLRDGMIVGTKGYHNIFDDGGAIYLISAVGTDYSIPLSNGLHAAFRDTFDIRKFGIVSSATLDQTEKFLRMRNYADTRVYEIDFLNFDLMSPKCINFTSARGTIYKGLYFHYLHKLKNAKFYHDKTEQLYQGAIPLQFTPKADGVGLFELENIRFDLYVADYFLVSGEGDGRFHGFYAGWHRDFPMAWPSSMQFQTGYSLKFDGIYADTPAITSTLALNLWCTNIDFKDMFGEYWAYYTTHFAERVTAENCHFVFRDDLHTGSGRVLVTNGFQEEQEVGAPAFPYHQKIQRFKNSSCYKKTDGARYPLIKRQVMGAPTLDLMEVDNCIGSLVIAAGNDKAGISKIKHLKVSNCDQLDFDLDLDIDLISFYKSENYGLIRTDPSFITEKMEFDQHTFSHQIAYTGVAVGELVIADSEISTANTNGIMRANALINKINIDGLVVMGGRLLECDFDVVVAKGITYTDTPVGRGFVRIGSRTTTSRINIDGMISNVLQIGTATIIETTDTKPIVGVVTNSTFREYPRFTVGTGGSLVYANSYPYNQVSVAYDPPALTSAGTVGDTATTTVTLAGAVVGDFVQATFSRYDAGIELSAVVSAANTVTVKFKNTTATAVDLPSGTLKVRLI